MPQSIRVTNVDGTVWSHELGDVECNVGRNRGNDLALTDAGVSGEHCKLEFDGSRWIVKDRGSANGTYINNDKLTEPTALGEGDRLYVGPYLLELVSIAPAGGPQPGHAHALGPLRRVADPLAKRRREDEQVQRWASQWDHAGRPSHLLVHGAGLARAVRVLQQREKPGELLTSFVRRSRGRVTRGRVVKVFVAFVVVGVFAGLAVVVAQVQRDKRAAAIEETRSEPGMESAIAAGDSGEPTSLTPPVVWTDHSVIPAETLEDIARRYDVPLANVARWNRLNPDDPQLDVGQVLRIKPKITPLPQQQIVYELEARSDWRKLSKRFDVPVDKLRAYNPEIGSALKRGTRLNVWIDPRPHGRRQSALDIPEFDIRADALAIGRPNDGRLENGIMMPKRDALYTRRAKNIMWGASYCMENLQTAIATFRRDVDFDGVLVVADISRRGGGHFPPHKSHQGGRDVDVWMPTLKGVYRKSHLGKDRKPLRNEIDFFALWGLIRSLIATDSVLHIFIEYELQEKVYRAAKLMGATDEELEKAMQWPRGRFARGILGHSAGHVAHIHVRFKCGPLETQCLDSIARE